MRAGRKQSNAELLIPIDTPRSPPRQRQDQRRPRRNSDSSIVGADKIMTEEEKKARDQRRRERERRQREAGGKDRKPASRKLDIIDQLDATSIYGTGSMWFSHSLFLELLILIFGQSSITTDLSMPSTPTATALAAGVHLCKPSLKARSTTPSVVLVL